MPNYPLYPDEPPSNVRCLTCGGLGSTRVDQEGADDTVVVVAEFPYGQRFDKTTNRVPHCIRGYWDIPPLVFAIAEKRAKEQGKPGIDDPEGLAVGEATLEILNEWRECDGWFPCLPGIALEAQFQMHDMIELEKDRRAWEKTLEDDRRAFEERLSERNETFLKHLHDDNKAADDKAKTRDDRLTTFFLILAGLEVLGTIAAVVIAVFQWSPW